MHVIIHTKITKCIRQKIPLYFCGWTIKSHSPGYEIGRINRMWLFFSFWRMRLSGWVTKVLIYIALHRWSNHPFNSMHQKEKDRSKNLLCKRALRSTRLQSVQPCIPISSGLSRFWLKIPNPDATSVGIAKSRFWSPESYLRQINKETKYLTWIWGKVKVWTKKIANKNHYQAFLAVLHLCKVFCA